MKVMPVNYLKATQFRKHSKRKGQEEMKTKEKRNWTLKEKRNKW